MIYSFFDVSEASVVCDSGLRIDNELYEESVGRIFAFSDNEISYSERIRRDNDRVRHLYAYALLSSLVSEYKKKDKQNGYFKVKTPDFITPLERIKRNENGKPYFEHNDLFFSISHSGNIVMAALSEKEIGADVQKRGVLRDTQKLANKLFTNEEQALDFYDVFCAKEATVKAIGEGIDRLSDTAVKKRTDSVTEGIRRADKTEEILNTDKMYAYAKKFSSLHFAGTVGRIKTSTGEEYSFSVLEHKK
ncbi:MAG: 4'-phosphopantetheinyl transferase superfamily protein [Eubacteriales bacterium]|nr:4'-phosphopantetheinyl transferase superfamily protein [Eubacteriales bacterium]